ncbi:MAG: OmpH family outer membrane protein [Bacteriovoracales bacterium]|nr:OmpH family outer membrane protein [Bacteriovoracales bacterium]
MYLSILTLLFSLHSTQVFSMVVGTIDMQKTLFSTKEGQKIRKKLEASFNKKKTALKKQENKLKKAKEGFDKKSRLLSADARRKEEKKLQKMLLDLEGKRRQYESEIRKMEADLTGPVVKRIYGVVAEVAKKRKVDVVFEKGSSPVIYAANKKDITGDVTKLHNKKYPGK